MNNKAMNYFRQMDATALAASNDQRAQVCYLESIAFSLAMIADNYLRIIGAPDCDGEESEDE